MTPARKILRPPRRFMAIFSAVALLGANLHCAPPAVSGEAGREIFLGQGAQPAKARLGEGRFPVPIKHAACAGCHGRDAQGYTEGGASAPAINASALLRATLIRKGYDLASFARVLSHGVDPSGRQLSSAMPRFELARAETESLLQYLSFVEQEQRTGINVSSLRLGVPVPGSTLELARHIIARFEDRWRQIGGGPIHGRNLKLVAVRCDPADEHLDHCLMATGVTALVFSPADPEGKLRAAAARLGMPFLLPFFALEGTESFRDVRGILPSRRDALRAILMAAPPEAELVVDHRYGDLVRSLGLAGGRRIISLHETTPPPRRSSPWSTGRTSPLWHG